MSNKRGAGKRLTESERLDIIEKRVKTKISNCKLASECGVYEKANRKLLSKSEDILNRNTGIAADMR